MDPLSFRDKYPPEIRDWWEKTLKSPRFIVAPMVDASELPWRMLSRKYKADLCFTPMFHGRLFAEDVKYRAFNLFNCIAPEDRPLIVQFCGNDPDVLVKAARLAKPYCEGIDINLGCPQRIAKNGHYGAFLMDEWDLISTIVKRIKTEVGVPISCKIRIFPDINKTIAYAQMLEKAGCFMLTVHGRTREQKGMDTGLADWSYIKAVRLAVNIPVVANGNIQYLPDVERCISETGVEAVMSAEGNLHNPKLFTGENPPCWEIGLHYLELVQKYPCPVGYSRGHLFKLYQHVFYLPENEDLRQLMASATDTSVFMKVTLEIQSRYERYVNGEQTWVTPEDNEYLQKLRFPPFICQPYVRNKKPEKPEHYDGNQVVMEKKQKISLPESVLASLPSGTNLSNNKIKKISKNPNKKWANNLRRQPVILCASCVNPKGAKCVYKLCKNCCKSKCFSENINCEGHKRFVKTHRETAKLKNALKSQDVNEMSIEDNPINSQSSST